MLILITIGKLIYAALFASGAGYIAYSMYRDNANGIRLWLVIFAMSWLSIEGHSAILLANLIYPFMGWVVFYFVSAMIVGSQASGYVALYKIVQYLRVDNDNQKNNDQ